MSIPVVPLDDADFTFAPWSWPFAQERRAEIDAHFAQRRAVLPQLWNGRVMLAKEWRIADRRLSGTCFETDFASFLAWRDWGFPDRAATNCFAMGALKSSDGAFLLGVMGSHTANAGLVYFPAGTPEPGDVVGGRLDLAGSITREVAEETGLTPDDYAAEAGWHAVPVGHRLAVMKILAVPVSAVELERKVGAHLTRETKPELSGIRIIRGTGDFDAMMPDFVRSFLAHALDGGSS
ncbi:MAG TPA: NUDIX hydrolase [Xanthobacteraceae bacterium]|jgi:8-oxo-dGTP pyrophosphatase MutT (NUDIX family)|nr:NUDIX hydrolase [Xanthobacteraceae bacterium]